MPKVKVLDNIPNRMRRADRENRRKAEEMLRPKKRAVLRVPDWLGEEAKKIFRLTRERAKNYVLLETIDTDILASYSQALAESRNKANTDQEQIAWLRIAISCCKELGITANGRARLALRKSKETPADEMDQLLEEITDFVNDV